MKKEIRESNLLGVIFVITVSIICLDFFIYSFGKIV